MMLNSPAGNFDGSAAASVQPWSAMVLTLSAVILPSFVGRELARGCGSRGRTSRPAGSRQRSSIHLTGLPVSQRGRDGEDVARVDGHLPAEPAADVGGHDADLVLRDGQPGAGGHEGEDGADGVRRLAGHPDGEMAVDGVPVGDATAGLDRGHVDARDIHVLLTRTSAAASAVSVAAASPDSQCQMWLLPCSGPRSGRSTKASGSSALKGSTTTASGS